MTDRRIPLPSHEPGRERLQVTNGGHNGHGVRNRTYHTGRLRGLGAACWAVVEVRADSRLLAGAECIGTVSIEPSDGFTTR
ncbi:MAG: hypothetical protein ABGY41_20125, partial [Candidatus Poribacteria bacterium]